ncbi:MAG: SurA N-terminal domain-containing protein, partial [Brevundimonas sp.]|nr:SurA N-terminal domain-containing protein [Brevundimonas sp.]
MRLQRYLTGVAMAALVAGSAVAQTAPGQQAPAAAGTLNPAAEGAPAAAPTAAPQFQMTDGILVTVNDSVITGFDLRQRMLLLIAMTQVQPTNENLPAIQQQALQLLISYQWLVGEAKDQKITVTDDEVKKQFEDQKKASFPKDADYQKFLTTSGQSEADILLRVKLDVLSNKIREKVTA